MSEPARQHVILCEGFDDRAFFRGWLLHLGCTDPTRGGKQAAPDVGGRPVQGGRYLFTTPEGSAVLVEPFRGRSKAEAAAREHLGGLQAHRPTRVILNLDSDDDGDHGSGAEDQVRGIAQRLGAEELRLGCYEVGGSLLYPLIWRCGDPAGAPGLPNKQTLERLIVAAILAAYPDRGPTVETWLEAAPAGLKLAKSYSASYFAKWHSNLGESHFFESLWRDERIVAALRERLLATGAWRVVEELVAD